jgi:hypothetical protein
LQSLEELRHASLYAKRQANESSDIFGSSQSNVTGENHSSSNNQHPAGQRWEYVYPPNNPKQQAAIRAACKEFSVSYKDSKSDTKVVLEAYVNSKQLGLSELGRKHGIMVAVKGKKDGK